MSTHKGEYTLYSCVVHSVDPTGRVIVRIPALLGGDVVPLGPIPTASGYKLPIPGEVRMVAVNQDLTDFQWAIGPDADTEIADGSVTASKLAITSSDGNLVLNGDFESADFAGTWQVGASGVTIAKSLTVFKSGTASGKVTTTGGIGGSMETVGSMSVTPGQEYTLSLWMYHDLAGALPGTHYVRVKRYDAAGTYIDVYLFRDNVSNSTISAWTRFEYTYVVPADTYQLRFDVWNYSNSTGSLYIDDVSFGSGPVLLLKDGVITAGVITSAELGTSSVTADKIVSNTITSSQLASNSVITRVINDGAVTAAKLGSTVLAGSWVYPTLQNGWVNFGGIWQTARYRKEGDVVRIEGMVKNGTLDTTCFTLPTDHRPPLNMMFPTRTSGLTTVGELRVFDTGEVTPKAGSNTWIWLNCTFPTT